MCATKIAAYRAAGTSMDKKTLERAGDSNTPEAHAHASGWDSSNKPSRIGLSLTHEPLPTRKGQSS